MTFETASRVEAIMLARSWCVRRTSMSRSASPSSPKRSARFTSSVARRVETSRCRRLSMTSSDWRSRSESEEKSLRANSGLLFMTRSREAFWMLTTLASVTASAKTSWPAPLDQVQLAEEPAVLEEGRGGLLVIAVDLVESHRAGEEEVELVVRVARGEDRVLRPEPALDHPEAGALEIVEVEPVWGARGGKAPGVVAGNHLTLLPL